MVILQVVHEEELGSRFSPQLGQRAIQCALITSLLDAAVPVVLAVPPARRSVPLAKLVPSLTKQRSQCCHTHHAERPEWMTPARCVSFGVSLSMPLVSGPGGWRKKTHCCACAADGYGVGDFVRRCPSMRCECGALSVRAKKEVKKSQNDKAK